MQEVVVSGLRSAGVGGNDDLGDRQSVEDITSRLPASDIRAQDHFTRTATGAECIAPVSVGAD